MGKQAKSIVRRIRVNDYFNRPIQTKEDLEDILNLLRDSLQKCIDEGATIILE